MQPLRVGVGAPCLPAVYFSIFEATTFELAVVVAPRVMVDNTSNSETPPSTDSEVVSRVGVADDLDVC